jgi:N-acetylglutamate synthase-like GNAT family acetyltransferase
MLARMNAPLPGWDLRQARASDVPALAALYADTARRLGGWCYTPEQVQAWASFGRDSAVFREYVLGARTGIAAEREGGAALGFCGICDMGEVRSLYVRADLVRRGLGSALLHEALGHAQARGVAHFDAWATPFSLPVFRRAGFELVQVVSEPFQGVVFERYRMAKD